MGGPLVLLVFLTWFLLPARKPPLEPYKSQARATHADYDPPQAAVVPAAIQTPIQASAAQPLFAQGSRLAEKKEEHRPMVVTYGGPPLPAYM